MSHHHDNLDNAPNLFMVSAISEHLRRISIFIAAQHLSGAKPLFKTSILNEVKVIDISGLLIRSDKLPLSVHLIHIGQDFCNGLKERLGDRSFQVDFGV